MVYCAVLLSIFLFNMLKNLITLMFLEEDWELDHQQLVELGSYDFKSDLNKSSAGE